MARTPWRLAGALALLTGFGPGCDGGAEDAADGLPPPTFVDARALPDLGGVDASPYFAPGPPLASRCDAVDGAGAPEVDPQPESFTFFDPPFYIRVIHLQNYGDGPLVIDDLRLDASPAFALYAGVPGEDETLVMTGGVSYLTPPLCIPPDASLMLFIRVDSIPGPLEDGWVFLETNRPAQPRICLPIWFGVNRPHEACP